MSDPVRVDSLDAIPEALHGHFAKVEADGAEVYEYRPPSSKTDDDVRRLDAALRKERDSAKQLREQLAQRTGKLVLGDEELDADEVKAALEAHRKTQGEQMITLAEAEKRAEERVSKARTAAKEKEAEWLAQITERDAQLDALLLDHGVAALVNSSEAPVRFRPEAVEDLQTYIRQHGLAKRNGTEIEVYELDGKTPLTTPKGERGTLADLVALIASKKPHWVVESQGAGSQPPLNGSAPRKNKSDMTMDEKISFITKYGEDRYAALPA